MLFFARQIQARRNTRTLVFFFALAVICIIFAVYLAVALVLAAADEGRGEPFSPSLFVLVALGTAVVVGGAAWFKVSQLAAGGEAVARLLGGRRVDPGTRDHHERVFVNIVEEMAIASGVPVPRTYVLDGEPGLNAFAAGWSPSDAVVAVTRGALEQLSRDELQGVVAHEFSHILNGDMRLNIRLMGTIFGITGIAMIGYFLLRAGASGGRGSSRKGGGGAAAVIGLGLALMAIGWIGVFFARLIQAAASRQREFLADASAVQFTRNPKGIGGALRRIAGLAQGRGGILKTAQAAEAGHFLFADGVRRSLAGLFATHPPLPERIRRIEGGRLPPLPAEMPAAAGGGVTPEAALGLVGSLAPENVAWGAGLLASLPRSLAEALREPFSARAAVFGLLLDEEREPRERQLAALQGLLDGPTYEETVQLRPLVAALPREARLPMADLAIPALRNLSAAQFRRFQEGLAALIEADQRVSPFEFALAKVLESHLARARAGQARGKIEFPDLAGLREECGLVLGFLARAGGGEEAAFAAAVAGVEALAGLGLPPLGKPEAVSRALDRLDRAAPPAKEALLLACARAVAADGLIQPDEADLLRAVADTLGCPMPPLRAGQGGKVEA